MGTFFQATLDKQTKTKTGILGIAALLPFIIVLAAAYFIVDALRAGQAIPTWVLFSFSGIVLSVFALIAVAIALTYLLAPIGYELLPDTLIIDKRLGQTKIGLRSIRSVASLDAGQLKGSIRVFGVDGFFGSYGTFHNSALGKFRMYSTRSSGLVLIEAEELFVLSPDDPEGFMDSVRKAVHK